jgi:phosphopantothenoylcysteine decarboxylase/phosphopantothenate--cysteine ligase
MDEDMWIHPATRRNLETVQSFGNIVIPVEKGELASGLVGEGRMAEPEDILKQVITFFQSAQSFSGQRVMVSAGPTYEPIDPVRFIGNHSSGKMGIAIALELVARGAMVDLVTGPGVTAPVHPAITVIPVRTAAEMFDACTRSFENASVGIMAAAVADYTPITVADQKIKKSEEDFSVSLQKTKDILKELGSRKNEKQFLVGFALETNDETSNALQKLKSKNADMIVLNSLKDQGAGFGHDTNKVTVFTKDGDENAFPVKSKAAVAADIIDLIYKKRYA